MNIDVIVLSDLIFICKTNFLEFDKQHRVAPNYFFFDKITVDDRFLLLRLLWIYILHVELYESTMQHLRLTVTLICIH